MGECFVFCIGIAASIRTRNYYGSRLGKVRLFSYLDANLIYFNNIQTWNYSNVREIMRRVIEIQFLLYLFAVVL